MKKFLVIGNPIEHSLSPKIHNYWMNLHNIKAIYEKALLDKNELKEIIKEVKSGKIDGLNITLPFKKAIIPLLDELTPLAKETRSVNTVFKKEGKIFGENTDANGFKKAIQYTNFETKNKSALILGAGGVVTSIIYALKKLGISKIFVSNRTKKYADEIKKVYSDIEVIDWGVIKDIDLVINATSLGLNETDVIDIDLKSFGKNKLFYDLIYNPPKTNFLQKAEKLGNQVENGKMMFAYQAQLSFSIWNGVEPKVDEKVIKILND
jgi:shikimate dehydrogenase